MTTVLIETEEIPVALSEGRALVERIAASVELRRAARLRAFLLYVCEQSLNHGVKVIHEQEIGIAVFGRPSNYDTGVDNIVRVNATELRRRLEHYFAEEGAREEVVLEIQRGNYSPTFFRRLPIDAPAPPQMRNQAILEDLPRIQFRGRQSLRRSRLSPSSQCRFTWLHILRRF
jgi:hypothetical protein